MGTFGIYGGQYGASTPAMKPKPKATDVFTSPQADAQPNQASPALGAPPANPFPAPPAAANPFGPVAPAANPGSFESLLNNAGPARAQNVQAAQQTVSEQLMPSPAPSRESATARSEFIKAQTEAGRQNREASSLSGRLLTGQTPGDVANFNRESLGQRADLENKLAINDASRAVAQQQQGVSNVLALEGLASGERVSDKNLASAEKLGFADLSIRERSLAQAGDQFKDELSFKKYAADRGYTDAEAQRVWQATQNDKQIASTEKVAFAGLNLEEKKIAQAGSQFDKKLDFDTWAKNQDMNEADRDRIWKSIENEKGRVFTATESALDRTLNQSQFAETIGLSKQQFSEQIRQFDSKQDFDKWATQKGLDAQAAEMVWKSNEADVDRKWQTGERLSTQEHQINITRLQGEIDKDKASFAQVLGIKTMEKQAEIDKLTAATANEYQTARDTRAMTHDESMEQMKAGLTYQLEQAGYDHQTAMQAAEIQANAIQKDQDRRLSTLEAKAELAYKYNALASEEGISKAQIAERKEESANSLMAELKGIGIDEKKADAAIKSQDFQDRAGMISTMMEMGGDNPDVADRATAMYLTLMNEKGLLTPEQYKAGMDGIKSGTANVDPEKTKTVKVNGVDVEAEKGKGPISFIKRQITKGPIGVVNRGLSNLF